METKSKGDLIIEQSLRDRKRRWKAGIVFMSLFIATILLAIVVSPQTALTASAGMIDTSATPTIGAYGGITEPVAAASPKAPSGFISIAPTSLDLLGYSSDLSDFLGQVVVNDGSTILWDTSAAPGSYASPITLETGKNYLVAMEFHELLGGRQFQYETSGADAGWIVYTLPDGLTFTPISGIVTGTGGAAIGQYQISGSTLRVKFGAVQSDGTPTPDNSNFIDYYDNCYFVIVASAQANASDVNTQKEVNFSGNYDVQINVVPQPPANGDMTIAKSMPQNIDPAAHTSDAVVTIGATSGPITLSSVSDQITFNDSGVKAGDIDIVGLPVVRLNGTVIPPGNYTISGLTLNGSSGKYDPTSDHFAINFTDPVTINPGDSLTVTYTLHIKDSYARTKTISGTAPNDNVLWNATLSNTVTGAGHRKSDNAPLNKSASASSRLYAQVITKSGAAAAGGSGTVAWTVNVGDGYTPLNGQQITDTLAGTATFSGTVTVTLYDAGKTQISTQTYTPGVADPGAANYGAITWSGSDSFTYTVPSDPGPGKSVRYATIQYNSTPDASGTTQNDARTTLPGAAGSGGVSSTYKEPPAPPVTPDWDIAKTGELNADATGGYILYTIKARVPQSLYNQPFTLTDSFSVTDAYNNWLYSGYKLTDYDTTLLNAYAAQNMTVAVYDLGSSYGSVTAANANPSNYTAVDSSVFNTNAPYNGSWYLTFSEGNVNTWRMNFGARGTTSVWPVDGNSLIIITYKVPLSSVVNDGSSPARTIGQVLTDAPNQSPELDSSGVYMGDVTRYSYLTNQALMSTTDATVYSSTFHMYETIEKLNSAQTPTHYSPFVSLCNGNAYWSDQASGQVFFPYDVELRYPYKTMMASPPVFTDTFDPTLHYAGTDAAPGVGDNYCKVALHFNTNGNAYYLYDILITVPKSQVIESNDGIHGTITIDFSQLSGDQAEVYSRISNGANDFNATVDYTQAPVYQGTTTECWNWMKTTIDTRTGGTKPTITGNWYDQNFDYYNTTTNIQASYSVYYVLTFQNPSIFPQPDARGQIDLPDDAKQTLYLTDGGTIDLTAHNDVKFNPLNKTLSQIKNGASGTDTADVVITINPASMTLAGGPGTVFAMHDKMTSLGAYLDTLKLYTYPGGVKTLQTLTPASGAPPAPGANGDPTGQAPFTYYISADGTEIWFFLPDNTSMELDYTVKIFGDAGQTVSAANNVSISGVYNASASGKLTVQTVNAQGGGAKIPLYLFKQAAQDKSGLSGATFALYGPVKPSGWDAWVLTNLPAGVSSTITVGTDPVTYYYLDLESTGPGGMAQFQSNVIVPGQKTLFAMREVSAPVGYNPVANNPQADNLPVILFSINNEAPTLPAGVTTYQSVASNILALTDTIDATQTHASVKISKTATNLNPGTWKPSTETMPAATFRMTQVVGSDEVTAVAGGYSASSTVTGLSASDPSGSMSKDLSFVIPGLSPGTTYYLITENDNGNDYWSFDQNRWIVTVSVDAALQVSYTYTRLDNPVTPAPVSAAFTNTYNQSSGSLPIAGGPGTRAFTLVAAALSMLLVLSGIGALIYKRRQDLLLLKGAAR